MATLDADVLTNHTPITAFGLRNGPAANATRTARASAIPAKYYYRGIRYSTAIAGDAATFLTPCPTALILEAQIRAAYAVLTEGTFDERRAAHPAGGAAFDEAAVRTAIRADPAFRLEAIALGSVHAANVVSYRIAETDLVPSETRGAIFALVAAPAAADENTYATSLGTDSAGWRVRVASGHTAANLDDLESAATTFANLSTTESELAYHLFALGQSSPVRAGCELFVSGHHYLSNSESTARHSASETEVFHRADSAVQQIWTTNKTMFRNAIWHKGIHFVMVNILIGFSTNEHVERALDSTGFGSFSVGLPAQEDILKRARAYLAVFDATRTTVLAHGHTVNMNALASTVRVFSALPVQGPLPRRCPAYAGNAAAAWPATVATRPDALRMYVIPMCVAAEPVAAWLYSFYKHMCDDAGIRPNSPEGSLLRSYALKRAAQNHLGEVNNAMACYEARKKYVKAQAAKGNLETRTLTA